MPDHGPERPSPPPPITLAIIRIALLLGILFFGATTMFVQRRGAWMPARSDSLEALRAVGIGVWAIAVVAVVVLRLRAGSIAARTGAATPSIVGWAIGEAVAVFGGVHYFLSGRPTWYINGVIFLVATFVLFPLARAGRRP